jgi:hypothetical protein
LQKIWERLKAAVKSILSWAKSNKKGSLIIGVLIVLALFFGLRSCRVGPAEARADKAEAIAKEAIKAAKEAEHEYNLDKSVWAQEKKDLNKKIETAMEVIGTISGQLDSSNFTLAQLQEILEKAKGFEAKYYAQVPIIAEYKKREAQYWKPLIDQQDKIILAEKQNAAGERRLRLEAEAGWEITKIALDKSQREKAALEVVVRRLKVKNAFTFGTGLVAAGAGLGLGLLLGK